MEPKTILSNYKSWSLFLGNIRYLALGRGVWDIINPDTTNEQLSRRLQEPPFPGEPQATDAPYGQGSATSSETGSLLSKRIQPIDIQIYQLNLQRYQQQRSALADIRREINATVSQDLQQRLSLIDDPGDALLYLKSNILPDPSVELQEFRQQIQDLTTARVQLSTLTAWLERWRQLGGRLYDFTLRGLNPMIIENDLSYAFLNQLRQINNAYVIHRLSDIRQHPGEVYKIDEEIRQFLEEHHAEQAAINAGGGGERRHASFSTSTSLGSQPLSTDKPQQRNTDKMRDRCLVCQQYTHRTSRCYYVRENRPNTWKPYIKTLKAIWTRLSKDQDQAAKISSILGHSWSLHLQPVESNTSSEKASPATFFTADQRITEIHEGSGFATFTAFTAGYQCHATHQEQQAPVQKDWFLMDTGANIHITHDKTRLHSFRPVYDTPLYFGNAQTSIQGIGDLHLGSLTLRGVAYVPHVHSHIISIAKLNSDDKIRWDLERNQLLDQHDTTIATTSFQPQGFWILDQHTVGTYNAIAHKHDHDHDRTLLWHRRLAHPGDDILKHLSGVTIAKPQLHTICETCRLSKAKQQISRQPQQRGEKPFSHVHLDVIFFTTGYNNHRYCIHFYCDFSRFHTATTLVAKTSTALMQAVVYWLNWAQRQRYAVQCVRLDNESGLQAAFHNFMDMRGIRVERSAPDTPQQNGHAERSGSMIVAKARSLSIESRLPRDLWPELILTAVYILNRTPVKALAWKTPYEIVYKTAPDLSNLRVIGSKAWVLITNKKLEKLAPRAIVGYLVGYEASNIWRIWIPTLGRVVATRDVRFDETQRWGGDTPQIQQNQIAEINSRLDRIDTIGGADRLQVSPELITNIEEPEASPQPTPLPSTNDQIQPVQAKRTLQLITPEDTPEPDQRSPTPEQPPYSPISEPGHNLAVSAQDNHSQPQEEETDLQPLPTTHVVPAEIQVISDLLATATVDPIATATVDPTATATVDTTATVIADPIANIRRDPTASAIRQLRSSTRIIKLSRRAQESYGANNTIIDPVLQAFLTASRDHDARQSNRPPPPRGWRDLQQHTHRRAFEAAAAAEYNSLTEKGTWTVVNRPLDQQIIPVLWVFTYKLNGQGLIAKHKARLCVRGDLQRHVNRDEISAATATFKTFRILMALAAAFDMEIWQLDVSNAFVNADINDEIYIASPDGFPQPGKCLRLNKALYGLRISPLLWLNELSTKLKQFGLTAVRGENGLFRHPDLNVFVFFYVDDILLIGATDQIALLSRIKSQIMEAYQTKDLGDISCFLNIRVTRDRATKTLWLTQDTYIDKIVQKFHLATRSRQPDTPATPGKEYRKPTVQASPTMTQQYQELVGSIIYPSVTARPDIAWIASKLSQYSQNPSQDLIDEARRVITYLNATRYLSLRYSASTREDSDEDDDSDKISLPALFDAASDASFADDLDTRYSSQGYCIKLFGSPILWQASRQRTITLSTTEAELLSLSHASKELLALQRLFDQLQFTTIGSNRIHCDNAQTVGLVNKQLPQLTTKLRHVDIHQFWLRQEVEEQRIAVQWTPSARMIADGFTKPLGGSKHRRFLDLLGLDDITDRIAIVS
jgi:hypothetical protein